MSTLNAYLFITYAAGTTVLGDYLLKLAADRDAGVADPRVIVAALIYASGAFGWLMAMKTIRLAEAGIAYSMITMLAAVAIGAWVFGETILSRDLLGIGFAVAAIVLLGRFA